MLNTDKHLILFEILVFKTQEITSIFRVEVLLFNVCILKTYHIDTKKTLYFM